MARAIESLLKAADQYVADLRAWLAAQPAAATRLQGGCP